MKRALLALGLSALTLSACSSGIIPKGGPATSSGSPTLARPAEDKPAKPIPSTPEATLPPPVQTGDGTNAAALGVIRGPQIGALQVDARKANLAMDSFKTSCPGLVRRNDNSGLTQGSDWIPACDAVKAWTGDAISFFAAHMDAVQVGNGKAFATGYYEPEIAGCRTPQAACTVPIYKRPADLIDVDLGQFSDDLKGKSIRGKVTGTKLVQYDDRAAIDNGALAGRGLEIAYAADPIEFFFLQIQ